MIVGLTGGIASGKTTISDLFAGYGVAVVDSDVVSRSLTAPGGAALGEIARAFGPEFVGEEGLNRVAMRALVFSDSSAKQKLEAILHPMIQAEVRAQVARAGGPYVILSVPLLVEGKRYFDILDRTLVVDVPETTQVQRLREKRGMDEALALKIIRSQASREERLSYADDVIVNTGSQKTLESVVAALHAKYLQMSAQKRDLLPKTETLYNPEH